jgi:hypothetical protein
MPGLLQPLEMPHAAAAARYASELARRPEPAQGVAARELDREVLLLRRRARTGI